MPWYGTIHPVMAIGTLVYGITLAQASLTKIGDWNFPLRRQRTRSVIFLLFVVANFIVGFVVSAVLRGQARGVKLTAHLPMAIGVVVIVLIATLVSFAKGKFGEAAPAVRWNPVLIVAALALTMTMVFVAVLALFGS